MTARMEMAASRALEKSVSRDPVVAIVGGGFSGTCCAIHLLRLPNIRLEILLIEPKDRLGGGLAHSSPDPDHRINAPASIHIVHPDQPGDLEAWLRAEGRIDRDPDAVSGSSLYPRRSDFGDYVRAQLLEAVKSKRIRSGFRHIHTHAVGLERKGSRFRIALQSGECIDADRCIVATGHERPSPPSFIEDAVAHDPQFFNDPWDLDALQAIDPKASVLLIGTGLTSADIVATLLRRANRGRVTALSRHGYMPQSQNPLGLGKSLWEVLNDPVPEFVAKYGAPARVAQIMRVLRRSVASELQQGRTWHGAFDEVRNAARQLWKPLPKEEKRRFLRHVRSVYDPHRFRLPPQTGAILETAMKHGQLTVAAGRIRSVVRNGDLFDVEYCPRGHRSPRQASFNAIVNCTGPQIRPSRSRNPIIRSLLEGGLACEDEAGIGLETNAHWQAVCPDGSLVPGLYFLGPLTRGQIGETPAVPIITHQVLSLIPGLIESLAG